MYFDARAAKLLKPGQHLTLDSQPGLRLVCSATRRTWIYRYKSPVDARMRQVKIGEWPAMSPAAAIVEWEKLRQARDSGRDIANERRNSRTTARAVSNGEIVPDQIPYTVRRMCDDYLVGHVERHRALKGAKEIRRMFDTMLEPIAHMLPEQVTRSVAFDLINSYAHIPTQAGKLRTELGAAWTYGHDSGRLSEGVPNWWREIMRGRLRSVGRRIQGKTMGTAKRVLTDVEVGELIRWLPNFPALVDDVLTLYLWTCARGAEIVGMEAEEISEEADGLWWTVPHVKTKNVKHEGATDLRVPLVGRAEAVVRRRLAVAGKGYLFPSQTTGHTEQKVISHAVWNRMSYCKSHPQRERARLPVEYWAPHDLRRTGRTMLAALGCPMEVGESILGHMLPGVEGVYNRHTYDRERREWLLQLSAHLEKCAATPKR
ncbi:tyrosine-type recombinase/integrase [Ralstonia chuxiongensis]|uniref:Integrase family protein n=1 Tax=Ralstonia chuxiongensis TaxID=2957504 RepID=A0AA42BHC1_9RALS|nr:integrase family protein [Ralstonia chuxiongensis]MCP1172995.1 integrase family protein [Ralstonia chuxiongensis]